MPRRSILREVQEEAYAPKKKTSPAPLILSLLLPLLLIPAILPIVDLITTSSAPSDLDLKIAGPQTAPPDITIFVQPDGSVRTGLTKDPIPLEALADLITDFPSAAPALLVVAEGEAETSKLLPLLETLQGLKVGELRFSSQRPRPADPHQ